MKRTSERLGRKGAIGLQQLPAVVMILFFVGITIGISAVVLYEFSEKTVPTGTSTNDSFTALNGTNVSLDHQNLITVSVCYETGDETNSTDSTYYTISKVPGYFELNDLGNTTGWNNTVTSCNYTYKNYANVVYLAQNDSINAVADFASWLGIIVIVIAAAVIIGLIMLFRGSGRK